MIQPLRARSSRSQRRPRSLSTTASPDVLDLGTLRPLGEGLNFASHALGFLLACGGALLLVDSLAGHASWPVALGCGIYATALVMVYAASTLSHAFHRPALRHFFRTLDQTFIFLLIAGTYTPWGLCFYRDGWGAVLLATMWLLAAAGALFKLLVKGHNNVATVGYVLLGWLPVLSIKPIGEHVPASALGWMLAGGLLYTLGTWFLNRDHRYPYYHVVWHLMVVAASACHFAAVMIYIVPAG